MKFDAAHLHHDEIEMLRTRVLYEWAMDVVAAHDVKGESPAGRAIRPDVGQQLEANGWVFGVSVNDEAKLTAFTPKGRLARQLQSGNTSRYSYDFVELQHGYQKQEIQSAILAVPNMSEAQRQIESNISYAERLEGL